MSAYADQLRRSGFEVLYIPSSKLQARGELFRQLNQMGVCHISLVEFSDEWLKKDLLDAVNKHQWKLKIYDSPGFLCSESELKFFFQGKEKFSMAQFYAYQRKKLNLLMEDGKPVGGKFSFDGENRKKLPKTITLPKFHVQNPTFISKRQRNMLKSIFPMLLESVRSSYIPSHMRPHGKLWRTLSNIDYLYSELMKMRL